MRHSREFSRFRRKKAITRLILVPVLTVVSAWLIENGGISQTRTSKNIYSCCLAAKKDTHKICMYTTEQFSFGNGKQKLKFRVALSLRLLKLTIFQVLY